MFMSFSKKRDSSLKLDNVRNSGSKQVNAMSECVQRPRHTLAAIADVEAWLLLSTLMRLHGTSLPPGQCLAARILYDYSFSHRRVLLEYSHQVSLTSAGEITGGDRATEIIT